MPILRTLFLLLALTSHAFAQDGARDAASAVSAAKEFRAYIDGVTQKGERPDLTLPDVVAQLNRIDDLAAFNALPPAKGNDLPWLLDWAEAVKDTNKLYIFYGAKLEPQPDFDAIGRNMLAYQDRYAASISFFIRLLARESASMTMFMAELPAKERTPVRAQAVAGFSRTSAETMLNAIGAVILGGAKPENARLVTGAMRDTRGAWANYLLPEHRTAMIKQLDGVLKQVTDETVKADLAAFSSALAAVK